MILSLSAQVVSAIWQQAREAAPRECVGVLGGLAGGVGRTEAQATYPLSNVAAYPEREYLADPGGLLRALRAMSREGLRLVAFYHSHPAGPATPSPTDTRLAAYDVPYLIADLPSRTLRGYLLPGGAEVEMEMGIVLEEKVEVGLSADSSIPEHS